ARSDVGRRAGWRSGISRSDTGAFVLWRGHGIFGRFALGKFWRFRNDVQDRNWVILHRNGDDFFRHWRLSRWPSPDELVVRAGHRGALPRYRAWFSALRG